MKKSKEGIKIKCSRCGHERIYKGKYVNHTRDYVVYTPCSICKTSIKIEKKKEIVQK